MWLIYEFLLLLGLLVYIPKAVWRRRLPHRGWLMRLGRYPATVRERLGKGSAIWIHAVSVGEVMAAQPLIQKLLTNYPQTPLVVSTITPAGFQVASRIAGERVVVIFAPLDFRFAVRRALALIQPRIVLLMESELWPTLIQLTKARGIPLVVVNGRVSQRAYQRSLRVKRWLAPFVQRLDLCLMQTDADAKRLIRMGAVKERVQVLGNLKWDAGVAARPPQAAWDTLRHQLGLQPDEPVIVAGSTHRGEETELLNAFHTVRAGIHAARLIIAPRHLERVGEVEQLIRQRQLAGQRTSRLLETPGRWDVAIVDTLGQLPTYYGLATVVFVGGSLIPHGGQNPIEPASLGKPVLVGPWMHNFSEITERLLTHQAAWQVHSGSELTTHLTRLLTDGAAAAMMGRRAQELTEESLGCAQRTLDALSPFLKGVG